MSALIGAMQLVYRIDVGFGRGNDYIGVRAGTINYPAGFFKSHRDFALGIRAGGDVVNRIQLQSSVGLHQAFNGFQAGVHRAAAVGAVRSLPCHRRARSQWR